MVCLEQPTSRRLRILPGTPDVGFRVLRAEVRTSDGAQLHELFRTRAEEDDIGWYVEVEYRGGAQPNERLEGLILIETDHPEVPSLTVPLAGVVFP